MQFVLLTACLTVCAMPLHAEEVLSEVAGNWGGTDNDGFYFRAQLMQEAQTARLLIWNGLEGIPVDGDAQLDNAAFALSAYNGGPRALERERALASTSTLWFGAHAVEPQRSRTRANWNENRTYVRRILIDWEPDYSAAGWRGGLGCGV